LLHAPTATNAAKVAAPTASVFLFITT